MGAVIYSSDNSISYSENIFQLYFFFPIFQEDSHSSTVQKKVKKVKVNVVTEPENKNLKS